MYKHYFFDLDGTLTPSKGKITQDMVDQLMKLQGTLYILSGASQEQMQKQLDGNQFDIMGQNGAEYYKVRLTDDEKYEIGDHIAKVIVHLRAMMPPTDIVEDRGSQISFSFVGHNANKDRKASFDPKRKIRKEILARVPFKSKTLLCLIAGSTCFDYIRKGMDKGGCIDKLIKKNDWKKEECIFFGDAIFDGGNDYSVKDVIKSVPVKDYKDTIKKLKKL